VPMTSEGGVVRGSVLGIWVFVGRIFVDVNTKVHVHMAKRTSSWSPPAFLMPAAFTSMLGGELLQFDR
jgi:hypothetical protein